MLRGLDSGVSPTQAINGQLRSHPIVFPLVLVAVGAFFLFLANYLVQAAMGSNGVRSAIWLQVFLDGFGALCILISLSIRARS